MMDKEERDNWERIKDYFETLPEEKRDNMFYKRAVAILDTGKDPMPQPPLKPEEDSQNGARCCHSTMLSFLLPLASKIISDAVAKIPDNEELGEKLIEITVTILAKAVKMTKTDMDDKLLDAVIDALQTRE